MDNDTNHQGALVSKIQIVGTDEPHGLGLVLGNAASQIARASLEIASAIREAAQLFAADRGLTYPWPKRGPNSEPISYPQITRQ